MKKIFPAFLIFFLGTLPAFSQMEFSDFLSEKNVNDVKANHLNNLQSNIRYVQSLDSLYDYIHQLALDTLSMKDTNSIFQIRKTILGIQDNIQQDSLAMLNDQMDYADFNKGGNTNISNLLTGGNAGVDISEKIIFGTVDIMIERAKAELTLKYLGEIQAKFETTFSLNIHIGAFSETLSLQLKNILPHIYGLLKNQDQVYNVNVGKSFQMAFESDLDNLPENLLDHLVSSNVDIAKTFKNIHAYVPAIKGLLHGEHPALVISKLAAYFDSTARPEFALFKLNDIISKAFMTASTMENYWINVKEFYKLTPDQKNKFIASILSNPDYKDFMKYLDPDAADQLNMLKAAIPVALDFLNHLDAMINELKDMKKVMTEEDKPQTISAAITAYTNYAGMFMTMMQEVDSILYLANNTSPAFSDRVISSKVFSSLGYLSSAMISTGTKNYTQSIYQLFDFIKEFVPETDSLKGFLKYTTLAADIAMADSMQQVKDIFNGLIMPVGSYKVKRSNHFTAGINSYLGLSGGNEWILNQPFIKNGQSLQFSPFAAVGFDLSWARMKYFDRPLCSKEINTKPCFKKGSVSYSNGLFISIFDMGAVVSYRFKNSGSDSLPVDNLPKVKLEQLIAPGLFFVHGMKNAPVTWGIGGQFNPLLRSISSGAATETQTSAARIACFVAVDIPFFTLGTGKRRE